MKPAEGEILVGAIDCKGIPMVKPERALRVVRRGKGEKANKKRMATVAAVHSQPPDRPHPQGRARQPVRNRGAGPSVRSARPQPQARVGQPDRRQGHVHHRRQGGDDPPRPPPPATWVIVTDGERALQRRVISTFTDVTLVLDLLHVIDKLCPHYTLVLSR